MGESEGREIALDAGGRASEIWTAGESGVGGLAKGGGCSARPKGCGGGDMRPGDLPASGAAAGGIMLIAIGCCFFLGSGTVNLESAGPGVWRAGGPRGVVAVCAGAGVGVGGGGMEGGVGGGMRAEGGVREAAGGSASAGGGAAGAAVW